MDSTISLLLIALIGVTASPSVSWRGVTAADRERTMADLVFLALTAAFFAASFGLVYLFERLREGK